MCNRNTWKCFVLPSDQIWFWRSFFQLLFWMWLDEIDKIDAWIWCIVEWVVEGGLIVKSNYFFYSLKLYSTFMNAFNEWYCKPWHYIFWCENSCAQYTIPAKLIYKLKNKKKIWFWIILKCGCCSFFLLSKYKFLLNFSYLVIYFSFVILKLCHSSIFR